MSAAPAVTPWHQVYYLTRPDFIKHDHIHKRKVEVLRAAGLKASLLSFVPEPMYLQRRQEYDPLLGDGLRQVIRVPETGQVNQRVRRFLLRRLLLGKRLLVHVLLCAPEPVLLLKRLPFFGRRVSCVIEHEGDLASECLYRWAYKDFPQPPDLPPPEYKSTYDYLVAEQKGQLLAADGAILVTPEHLALWEQRLNRKLRALTLPTFFDPGQFTFSVDDRQRVRSQLGVQQQTVLVYSGSVSLEWQRFECVCDFVAHLARRGHQVHLLALVHPDGHTAARELIEKSGISASTTLKSVPPRDMAAYLSAADLGLFLRHNHTMNRVVTSAKLGEYLAAGLPLVTTWACPYYRLFVEQHQAAVALPDSLELPAGFDESFAVLARKGKDASWRAEFSRAVKVTFSEQNDPLNDYVAFIAGLLRSQGQTCQAN